MLRSRLTKGPLPRKLSSSRRVQCIESLHAGMLLTGKSIRMTIVSLKALEIIFKLTGNLSIEENTRNTYPERKDLD